MCGQRSGSAPASGRDGVVEMRWEDGGPGGRDAVVVVGVGRVQRQGEKGRGMLSQKRCVGYAVGALARGEALIRVDGTGGSMWEVVDYVVEACYPCVTVTESWKVFYGVNG